MFFSRKKKSPTALAELGSLSGWSVILQRFLPTLRRRASGERALEHLDSLALTAKSSLALVRWRDQTLLLGVTPQGISLLIQNEEPKQPASHRSANTAESLSSKELGR